LNGEQEVLQKVSTGSLGLKHSEQGNLIKINYVVADVGDFGTGAQREDVGLYGKFQELL